MSVMAYLSLFLCCLVVVHGLGVDVVTDVVVTESGPIVGKEVQYDGQTVSQYLGIPFAEPPIEELRFRKPVMIQPWNSTYQALRFQASCIQNLYTNDKWLIPTLDTSEDCLHLNVFVPNVTIVNAKKAVMVWIHGGGFTNGQSSMYDGSYLALKGGIIVVTINYRLGLLGFLSTGDKSARGNYGLWDQSLAIKWVHDNIENFGGDKDRVTIFGESAGGYSASLQTLLPVNKGHFSRAISESGTACSPSAVSIDVLEVAKSAAEKLGCPVLNDTSEIVECLRSMPAEKILDIQDSAFNSFDGPSDFHSRNGAVVDGELLTDTPINLLNDKDSDAYQFFKSLDILAGSNNAEALMYWSMAAYQNKYNYSLNDGIPNEVLCNEVVQKVSRTFYNSNTEVEDAICKEYSRPGASLAESGQSILDVYSDMQFMIPAVRLLDYHAENQTTYMNGNTFQYVFTHQPAYSWIQDRPAWLIGANHCDEEAFVFGLDAMYPEDHVQPDEEKVLSDQIMTYWTNFANTG